MAKEIRVVQLVRISLAQQSLTRQKEELDALCEEKGWKVVLRLEEVGSGSKNNKDRDSIKQIEQLAEQGKIDKVIVQELSRLGRKTGQSISLIEKLADFGVSVYEKSRNIETLNEDGTPNAISSMILSLLASLHSMESSERNSRIVSGIKSRQRAGLPFGRPEGSCEDDKAFLAKHIELARSFKNGEKLSLRKRSRLYKRSVNTVRKVQMLCLVN
jgi:DNA invertase Pin-like site-specific DNA recombinase